LISRIPYDTAEQALLRRPPVPAGGHRPRRLALLPFPAEPADGRGDAGGAGHHRQPRDGAAVEPQVRPGVRQPDSPAVATEAPAPQAPQASGPAAACHGHGAAMVAIESRLSFEVVQPVSWRRAGRPE